MDLSPDYIIKLLTKEDSSSLSTLKQKLNSVNDVLIEGEENIDLNVLHVACSINNRNRDKIVAEILKWDGIDIDLPSGTGNKCRTALHIACAFGYASTVELLVRSGADPYRCDSNGNNAWDLSSLYEHSSCIAALERIENSPHALKQNSPEHLVYQLKSLKIDAASTLSDTYSSDNTILYQTAADGQVLDELFTEIEIHEPVQETPIRRKGIKPEAKKLFSNTISTQSTDLSCSFIQQELKKFGYNPGPITPTTKNVYLKQLESLRTSCVTRQLSNFKFSEELTSFFEDGFILNEKKTKELETQFIEYFDNTGKKTSFNYILLDPRLTQILKRHKGSIMNDENKFKIFIQAVFYVGKGQGNRPLEHLKDARKSQLCIKSPKSPPSRKKCSSEKISRILEIWKDGYGVISLTIFNHKSEEEAFAREFLMIESIGLKNLTNIQAGKNNIKGLQWNDHKRRFLGAVFLNKAYKIFIATGETQIKASDIIF